MKAKKVYLQQQQKKPHQQSRTWGKAYQDNKQSKHNLYFNIRDRSRDKLQSALNEATHTLTHIHKQINQLLISICAHN